MTTICKDGDGKEKEIRENLISAGQEHLLAHVDSLQSDDREKFLNQLSSIKVDQIEDIYKASKSASEIEAGEVSPFVGKPGRSSDTELVSGCKELGMKAISQTKVAALVLAGGQGTRLGFSGPKGMYDIGLTSGRSLFEMMSLRIRRLQALADDENAVIPFYIMTSPMNHDETVKYFKSNSYFGLSEANVFFFPQGTLPCITEEGKIILEEAGKVAVAPDGNGGIYPALESSGALADMEFRGIEFIHVFSIDNVCVTPSLEVVHHFICRSHAFYFSGIGNSSRSCFYWLLCIKASRLWKQSSMESTRSREGWSCSFSLRETLHRRIFGNIQRNGGIS